jgi:hypothetical protein
MSVPTVQWYFRSIDHRGPRRKGRCSVDGCGRSCVWAVYLPRSMAFLCGPHLADKYPEAVR